MKSNRSSPFKVTNIESLIYHVTGAANHAVSVSGNEIQEAQLSQRGVRSVMLHII